MLREGLILLRKKYQAQDTQFQKVMAALLALSVAAGFAADILLPFKGWANVLRAFIVMPIAVSLFSLSYLYSLKLHDQRMQDDSEWVPFRLRWSRLWRRRMAAVAAAVLFVLVYASSYKIGYTLIAALFMTAGLALMAFIRPTKKELKLEELEIPDARDVVYRRKLQERTDLRRLEEELKERTKAKSRVNPLRRKDNHD